LALTATRPGLTQDTQLVGRNRFSGATSKDPTAASLKNSKNLSDQDERLRPFDPLDESRWVFIGNDHYPGNPTALVNELLRALPRFVNGRVSHGHKR
jgi:hypothetical protein